MSETQIVDAEVVGDAPPPTRADHPEPGVFTTHDALVVAGAGLYCEGHAQNAEGQTGTWRLPVIAFDKYGRPLVAAVGSVRGQLVPAEFYDPGYVLLATVKIVPGSDAPVEFTDADGITRTGFVPAWGVDYGGTVTPMTVAPRHDPPRKVEYDSAGRVAGVVSE